MKIKKFILRDSGKRESFKSGARRDVRQGKGRYDLISVFGLARLAAVMEKGALKYGERNYELGMPYSRFIDSAIRHITQYVMGMQDEDHLAQACFNLFAIMHMEATHPDLDDMPKYLNEKNDA